MSSQRDGVNNEGKQSRSDVKEERDSRHDSAPDDMGCSRAASYLDGAPIMLIAIDRDQRVTMINQKGCNILGASKAEILGTIWTDQFIPPEQRDEIRAVFGRTVAGEIEPVEYYENPIVRADGELREIAWHNSLTRGADGEITGVLSSGEDITERRSAQSDLNDFAWMLDAKQMTSSTLDQVEGELGPYGNLVELNQGGLILSAVGEDLLQVIAGDFLDLLETSAAVYEANGDYAMGIFASGWCRLMDRASRSLCQTDDNREALSCGEWLCHESCWKDAAQRTMTEGGATDIACVGGIRLYSTPIRARGEIVGVINFGYGNPPTDPKELEELGREFQIDAAVLRECALSYRSRPTVIVEMAKRRLHSAARLIGVLVERYMVEQELSTSEDFLERIGEMARVGGWEIVDEFTEVAWTATTARIHEVPEGYTPAVEEAIDFFHPDDQEEVSRMVDRAIKEGRPYEFERRLITAKGHERWVRSIGEPEMEDGRCVRLSGTMQDITEHRAIEEARRKSDRLLRWAIEQMPVPVLIADAPDGTISHSNQSAIDVLTMPSTSFDEIRLEEHREHWPTFYPDGSPYDVADLPLARAIQKGEFAHDVEMILRRDDGDRWLAVSAAPLVDEDGEIAAGIVVFPDITERKEVEHALRQTGVFLDTVLDQSPFAMWVADPSGTVRRTNQALREKLDLDDDMIVGKYSVFEDHNIQQQGLMPQVRRVFDGHIPLRFDLEWAPKRLDSVDFSRAPELHIDVAMYPVVDDQNRLEWVVCQWVDITEQKTLERQLVEFSRDLEERVEKRTAELRQVNAELESFAYSVSHDLRAPLRAISGFAQIIESRYREDLNDEGRHYFDNIVEASDQMSQIIDDLLEYSRLGRRGVVIAEVDLNSAVDGVLTVFADEIKQRGARVEVAEDLPVVLGNTTLVEQIIANLVSNALKYQPPDHIPELQIQWRDCGDGCVQIDVQDNGIGIDERHQEKVFDVFQRLHPSDAYPGTGIGLAIVAKAAKCMDGRVWVESRVGEGSVFHVSLPRVLD